MKQFWGLLLALALLLSAAGAERLTDEQLEAYYDGSLFVGDSLERQLSGYIKTLQKEHPEYFRDAVFIGANSYQLRAASRERPESDAVNLLRKGRNMTLCQIAGDLKPTGVFLLAGINDRIDAHPDVGMKYVTNIVALMEKYAPDSRMHFLSLTPITERVNGKNRQAALDEYNEMLRAKCGELGAFYVDIATGLKDENGLLPLELSRDREYHLNDAGNARVVELLLDFAQAQYDAGLWKPED